ncbi:MAG: DUF3147 family protein [Candidatus Thermoplasmatota archaeon]|nr:DUF3147 family protein [Candidatus Thermoplasmatota archaeon]
MIPLIYQIVAPFVLSALIVIVITVIAENYGTKLGGILGTLPSTIVIAFVFIALNRGNDFASESASVVPAEMGINILFLFTFAVLAYRRTAETVTISLVIWSVLSSLLYFTELNHIYISLFAYAVLMIGSFLILEKKVKIRSVGKVDIEYTPKKIAFRGVIAGTVIAISVFLSNINPVLSGIFSVFPAIFLSTMLIFTREHGPKFVGGSAKSMIFGTPSVVSYAVAVHFLYPRVGILFGSVGAYLVSLMVVSVLLLQRGRFS